MAVFFLGISRIGGLVGVDDFGQSLLPTIYEDSGKHELQAAIYAKSSRLSTFIADATLRRDSLLAYLTIHGDWTWTPHLSRIRHSMVTLRPYNDPYSVLSMAKEQFSCVWC